MEFKKVNLKTMLEFENKYGKNMLTAVDSLAQGENSTILTTLVELLSVLIDEDPVQFLEDNFLKLEEISKGIAQAFESSPLFKTDNTPSK